MARFSQKEDIYDFIEKEYKRNGVSPSLSEIALHLGLTAKSNIHKQIQLLVAEGRLLNLGGRYVPAALHKAERTDISLVPLLGTVAAGTPILAVENLEGYVPYLPQFGDGNDLFALRIKGDSMIEAGILSGDIVIVRKAPVAENGEIVVALIDDEATVKTLYREHGHIRLQPENREMSPIIVDEAVILGRVVSSMRYY